MWTRNSATIENVRLWDHQPLLDTFGQLQVIRTYYDFMSVDNDRYRIGGALRQIMLSPRELDTTSLPNRTWINDRLTFTHGYGLTLGPVNQVTSEGLPVLYVGNLPLETTPDLPIEEPSLYFGEMSNDYVIVRTATREFHYPRSEGNVFTQYDGRGGLSIGSFWRKLLFALRFGAYQILLSSEIGEREPDPVPAAISGSGCRRWRRSWPSIATLTSSSPTAACSGCTTPTRPATATRTRRRADRRPQLHP